MLAKKNRLNLSLPENSAIFIRGNSVFYSSKFFLAYSRENKTNLEAAFLVPKAVFSSAAKRNFYRRMLYIFFEELLALGEFSLESNLDLVIVLKKNFRDNLIKGELRTDLFSLLNKVKLKS